MLLNNLKTEIFSNHLVICLHMWYIWHDKTRKRNASCGFLKPFLVFDVTVVMNVFTLYCDYIRPHLKNIFPCSSFSLKRSHKCQDLPNIKQLFWSLFPLLCNKDQMIQQTEKLHYEETFLRARAVLQAFRDESAGLKNISLLHSFFS